MTAHRKPAATILDRNVVFRTENMRAELSMHMDLWETLVTTCRGSRFSQMKKATFKLSPLSYI